jgi:integrase
MQDKHQDDDSEPKEQPGSAEGGDQSGSQPPDPEDFELPDPREVNRAESERLKAEKKRERRRQTGVGTAVRLIAQVCKAYPGDPHRQIAAFLRGAKLYAGVGRPREVSELTRTNFGTVLHCWVDDLTPVNCRIQNITELRRTHAMRVLKYYVDRGDSAGWLQTKTSCMRRFFALIGRPEVLPVGSEWIELVKKAGIDPARLERHQIAVESKSWHELGVDPLKLIEAIREEFPVIAVQMELQIAFGLRLNESMQFEPFQCDAGTKILVIRGTKGGRPRSVDLDADPQIAAWQRDILDRAAEVARKHGKRRVATPGLTLVQSRNHYNYVMRKFGITKAALGVTSHGLRHAFAAARFKAVSGLPAPVEGKVPSAVYRQNADALGEAAQHVTEQLGHARRSITGAYLGSVPMLAKIQEQQLGAYVAQLERAEAIALFFGAGATEAWITGRAASGLVVSADHPLELAVRVDDTVVDLEGCATKLQDGLAGVLQLPLKVSLWLKPDEMPQGVEVRIVRPNDEADAVAA